MNTEEHEADGEWQDLMAADEPWRRVSHWYEFVFDWPDCGFITGAQLAQHLGPQYVMYDDEESWPNGEQRFP